MYVRSQILIHLFYFAKVKFLEFASILDLKSF